MQKPLQIRQGDILLERVEKVPDDAGCLPSNLLKIEGEHTGHAHQLPATLLIGRVNNKVALFAVVHGSGAFMRHEEHNHLRIPPGNYRVIQQQQRVVGSPHPIPVPD